MDYQHHHPYTRPLDRRELEYMGADEDALTGAWNDVWQFARGRMARGDIATHEEAINGAIDAWLNVLQVRWQPVIDRLARNLGIYELNKPISYPVETARNPFRRGTPAYNHWQRKNGLPEIAIKPPDAVTRPTKPTVKISSLGKHLTTELIQGLGDKQKTLARRILAKALKNKLTPQQIAVELGNVLGLNDRWAKAVENLHAKLLENGMSEKMAAHRAQVYARKLVRKRGIMVARTELARAANAAVFAAWQQKEEQGALEGYIVEKWLQPMSGACPECWYAADPDSTGGPKVIKGLSTRFETAEGHLVDYPPLHPHCRCQVVYRVAWA